PQKKPELGTCLNVFRLCGEKRGDTFSSMNQIKLRMGPVEWALLLLLSVIWGGSFLLNGLALRSFPPIFIAASRVVIGAAALGIFAAATGRLNGGLLK